MMDIDNFLLSQKNKLKIDKNRLTLKILPNNNFLQDNNCIKKKTELEKNCNEILGQSKQWKKNSIMDFQPHVNDPSTANSTGALQSQRTSTENRPGSTMATSPINNQLNVQDDDTANNVFQIYDNLSHKCCQLGNRSSTDKSAKDLANLTERHGAAEIAAVQNSKLNKNKVEMEQWVTDTFYSYFPGFNNENKKRQEILHERQLEYQQNFLKHQMIEAAANRGKKKFPHSPTCTNTENTNDSNHKPLTSCSDKTDLEIIVNNPDYEAKSPRPGSARHKLLRDLRHTEISQIVNSDGVTERNKRIAEVEISKKRDYQKDLIAQIEEKRLSIEILKEKERRQEEALTRKLQEQLRTIRLQEELEKEKMRADKVRFDSEQNRQMREHLLSKLENDTKLLYSTRKSRSENDKAAPPENKVYKYFSNSARHEYRRSAHAEQIAFHLDLPQSSNLRNECFHSGENVCPFCDSSLKRYESWCLKCEKRIFKTAGDRNLACDNCKKKYSVCPNCDKLDQNHCIHCEATSRICLNCRKTLCSDCTDAVPPMKKDKQKTDSERSFQILELNFSEESDEDSPQNDLDHNKNESSRPPYSMNIDRNSIFHHSFNHSKLFDDENNIDEIRHETDKRLSRYLKNYGDLASKALRDRSTQTTPDSASRRDIVMVEENNLSMPLLREMPRMTRKESNLQQAERKKKGTLIENLARRWEVPAVQKHTITTNSPKILTQLGAIRKQLQTEQLQLNY